MAVESHKPKLPELPKNAKVSKRPLSRPAIPSPYTSSDELKVVYVSAKTPFMSAVKRVEKLLRLAEKRQVQSITATARQENPRKRVKLDDDKVDEISSIAQTLYASPDKEKVVVKATGKAIYKALEIGAWFQQRQQYLVKLQTDTVESVDDIEIDVETTVPDEKPDDTAMQNNEAATSQRSKTNHTKAAWFELPEQKDESRIRQLSVINVYISLR